ncbi:MAG: 30S ribosomal protein S6 [Xanthomonadaceae bacterium]|nr:30S ribosomal protein S6 [Rhodospirillaceae bacterium]NIA18040.1 30S ribosomal protein S6 [Xanthomonadaceae bacterium]
MNYEILYIIPTEYSETEIKEKDEKVLSILKECGASIIRIDNWGKKKLAYQIKNYRYGYYTLIIFYVEANAIKKITQKLNINQDVIRFQIVKEIKQIKKTKSKNEKTKKTEEKSEKKEIKIKDKDRLKKNKEGKEEKLKKTEKNFSIDELDEKLSKLLKDTI